MITERRDSPRTRSVRDDDARAEYGEAPDSEWVLDADRQRRRLRGPGGGPMVTTIAEEWPP